MHVDKEYNRARYYSSTMQPEWIDGIHKYISPALHDTRVVVYLPMHMYPDSHICAVVDFTSEDTGTISLFEAPT